MARRSLTPNPKVHIPVTAGNISKQIEVSEKDVLDGGNYKS